MTIDTVLWSSKQYRKLRIVFKYTMSHNLCGTQTVLVRGGAALQSGTTRIRFTMVSLEFFTDLILPAPGSTQRLTEISTRNIS